MNCNMITAAELQKYLGNQVKRYRKKNNLSQEQLAEKMGIATNSLSSIETGNSFMTVNTLEKLLNILNVSARELFDFPEAEFSHVNKKEVIIAVLNKIENDEEKLNLLYNFTRILG